MYICVDFDGTIVDHCFPELGAAVPGALRWLKRLHYNGAKIILYTMRSDDMKEGRMLSEAVEYLEDCGLELFGINRNPTQDSWTGSPKAFGHVYVDDAAFGCPLIQPESFNRPCVDWEKIGPELERMLLTR